MWWRVLLLLVGTLVGLAPVFWSPVGGRGGHPADAVGDPDLQGRWQLATMTPLERPAGFEDSPRLTGADGAAFLETRRTRFRTNRWPSADTS